MTIQTVACLLGAIALSACASTAPESSVTSSELQLSRTVVRNEGGLFSVRNGVLYRLSPTSQQILAGPVDGPGSDKELAVAGSAWDFGRMLVTGSHVYFTGLYNLYRVPVGGGSVEDLGRCDLDCSLAQDGGGLLAFQTHMGLPSGESGVALNHITSVATSWSPLYSAPHVPLKDLSRTRSITARQPNGTLFGAFDDLGPYRLDVASGTFKFITDRDGYRAACPGYVNGVGSITMSIGQTAAGLLLTCAERLVAWDPTGSTPPKVLLTHSSWLSQGVVEKDGFAYVEALEDGAILRTNVATGAIDVIVAGGGAYGGHQSTLVVDGSYLYFGRKKTIERVKLP